MFTHATVGSSAHVELEGVDFAYSDIGSGAVVLDAHGLSSSRANNARLGLADFSPVAAAGRRLISYDARGHGESTGTGRAEDYSWDSLGRDLLAFADHFSPEKPVSAIGSSMGTGSLLHAATQRPERFDRLVLTAPPTAWDTRAGQVGMYRMMADLIETGDPKTLAAMMAQAPVPKIFSTIESYPPSPDIAHNLMPTVFRGAAIADLPPIGALATLAHPTLILAWSGDPGHPVSTAEQLAAAMPNASLHVSDSYDDLLTWGNRAALFLGRSGDID